MDRILCTGQCGCDSGLLRKRQGYRPCTRMVDGLNSVYPSIDTGFRFNPSVDEEHATGERQARLARLRLVYDRQVAGMIADGRLLPSALAPGEVYAS
jgi:hypothetical protein